MVRYLTRRYVAVSWVRALQLSLIDHTPFSQIRDELEVDLIHRTEWWAWWSDERLTTAIGLPERINPSGLSPDAEALISVVWESESQPPRCGWRILARVQRILARKILYRVQPTGCYFPGTWEVLIIQFTHGETGTLYRFWRGLEEGYCCEIQKEPPQGLD